MHIFIGECPTYRQRRKILRGLLALTLILIGCEVSTLVGSPQVTAPVPGAVDTIVALTAAAASTQTAAVTALSVVPTFTASSTTVPSKTPSQTPSQTPSATPTFLFILPTLTLSPTVPPASAGYACTLTDQTPSDGDVIARNVGFKGNWTVQNTGVKFWDTNIVDFIYLGGSKLTQLKAADLPVSVATGNKTTLTLSMTAPNGEGTYKTVWTLRAGKIEFCKLSMSIVVK